MTFIEEIRKRNLEGMELGIQLGWWPSYDDRGPHPWPYAYIIVDKKLKRETYIPKFGFGLWEVQEEQEYKFLSQLLVRIGVFSSVSDAIKAGHGLPITPGEYWFKKRTIHLFIENE